MIFHPSSSVTPSEGSCSEMLLDSNSTLRSGPFLGHMLSWMHIQSGRKLWQCLLPPHRRPLKFCPQCLHVMDFPWSAVHINGICRLQRESDKTHLECILPSSFKWSGRATRTDPETCNESSCKRRKNSSASPGRIPVYLPLNSACHHQCVSHAANSSNNGSSVPILTWWSPI